MRKIDEGRAALCKRVEAWALGLAVQKPRVRIQQMSRKWGSCSTLGTLTLASDLAEREAGFQDFVIVHELLHFPCSRYSYSSGLAKAASPRNSLRNPQHHEPF